MKIFITALVLIALVFISIVVGVKNDSLVTVNYLIAQSETTLSTVIAFAFGIGFIVAWLFSGLLYARVYFSRARLRRKVAKLEGKLTESEKANNRKKAELLAVSDQIKIEKLN